NFGKTVMSDTTGISLTFGQTLTAGILLSRHIRNFAGDNIAILFPASVGGALAHIATAFTSKTPVGMNFLAGKKEQEHVLQLCEIKTIFTSRKFIEKANIPEDNRMVFIEDINKRTSKIRKIFTYFTCKYSPKNSIIKRFKEHDSPDKTAIILFTSGSESNPKGVPLTAFNVYSAIQSYSIVFDPTPEDVVLGTLPFFHVFGFTVCLWFPLTVGIGVVYHPIPTDYERLGKIVQKSRITMLLGTSTLYRGFTRKWNREQVANVRLAFAGAEKLNENVRKKCLEKLGVNILEGYGVTESTACISVNPPNNFKHGSVGKLLPDIKCKIVDPDTFKEVEPGKEGLILIKGPNVMKGYYKSKDLTNQDLTDQTFYEDFYITGDIGRFDDEFLYITDRLKRFAKIGGEMVPLLPIEDKLSSILDENGDGEKRMCAVVSIPHIQKGEQLVCFVVETKPDKLILNSRLDENGVTKLSQPDHYLPIDAISMLPSGKVDYKDLKQLAIEQLIISN
ncbi:MAG: AMP-binding protein, partial [Candidatus Anammoxibacter sp.]